MTKEVKENTTHKYKLKDASEIKLYKYFVSKEELEAAIKKFIICSSDMLIQVLNLINTKENKDEIYAAIVKEEEHNDKEKNIIANFTQEFTKQNIYIDCSAILCTQLVYEDEFGNQYDSQQDCIAASNYNCDDRCLSEDSSPVSEEELLDIVRNNVNTEEGKKFAKAIGSFWGSIIDDAAGAVADTAFESVCANCLGVANKNLHEHTEL